MQIRLRAPLGAPLLTAGENEAVLLQTLSLFLSWAQS